MLRISVQKYNIFSTLAKKNEEICQIDYHYHPFCNFSHK